MLFTVVWLDEAMDQLAQIWLDADDRAQIASSSNTIDALLSINPAMQGEVVAEGLRKLRVPPLSVLFSVREADRVVEVANVHAISDHIGGQN